MFGAWVFTSKVGRGSHGNTWTCDFDKRPGYIAKLSKAYEGTCSETMGLPHKQEV